MLQNHISPYSIKFKVQDRPMNFNRTDHDKLIEMVSDFTLQLVFKKLSFVVFWYSIKEE
jgi:hypothetical protein